MANLDITHAGCPNCKKTTRYERKGVNHILHLLISVLLIGLWIPVWIILTLTQGAYICSDCGHSVKKTSPLIYVILAPFALFFAAHVVNFIYHFIKAI